VRTPVTVGVVGLGDWGPRLVRIFDELPTAELRWLCDESPAALLRLQPRFPAARTTVDIEDLLADEELDAVVIATPAATHHRLARRAIDAEKHVLVETPLTLSGAHSQDLVDRAERLGRRLMGGHVLLFHPAIRRLKELIDGGALGDIYYLRGSRLGLGKPRLDVGVVGDLGPHDVAAVLYLLGDEPVEVTARGGLYGEVGVVDAAFCTLVFATGIQAHLQFSWLEPQRTRRLSVIGSERMAVFDDLERERKLTLCERLPARRENEVLGHGVGVGPGDLVSLRLPDDEPLRLECEHFLTAIRSSADMIAGARESASVVNVLEALQHSLDANGRPEPVGGDDGATTVIQLPVPSPGLVAPARLD
jgi:predicted dehydrogenase